MASAELQFEASMHSREAETLVSARQMEALGYDYFSIGEHYMQGNPPLPTSAALPLLGVAAGATERIRILSSIVLVPFYHPTVLAKLATTLDNASGGRLTLGIRYWRGVRGGVQGGRAQRSAAGQPHRREPGGPAPFVDRRACHE